MRFILALLALSSPAIAQIDGDFASMVNRVSTLEKRVDAIERSLKADCPCGDSCKCPPGACPADCKPSLRVAYESEVRNLADLRTELKREMKNPEAIARVLHKARRDLGVKYKALTEPEMLTKIYQRNREVYDDPLGPTIDWLREHGKTWDEIAESASQPGDWPPKEMKATGLTYTGKGREVLLFTADWCAPCKEKIAELGSELLSRLCLVNCTDGNPLPQFGDVHYPTLILLIDGKIQNRSVGEFGKYTANKWLTESVVTHKTESVIHKPISGSQTIHKGDGHTHTCRSCGTSWSHANNSSNASHNCPSCGRTEYGNRTEGWTANTPRRSAPVVRINQGGYWQRQCSGGVCRNVWVAR